MTGESVFLSYRRDDSEGYAGRLYDRLSARFPDRIFRDVKDLEPGVDFVEEIERKLSSCRAMVAVIGPRWLTLTDGAGRRRIDQPDDLHRLEIVTALKRKVRVIPALVGGAGMPPAEELPAELAVLARRQSLPVSEVDFDHDVARLIEVLEKELGESRRTPIVETEVASPGRSVQPRMAPAIPAPSRLRGLRWMIAGMVLSLVLVTAIGLSWRDSGPVAEHPSTTAGPPQPVPSTATPPQPAPSTTVSPSPTSSTPAVVPPSVTPPPGEAHRKAGSPPADPPPDREARRRFSARVQDATAAPSEQVGRNALEIVWSDATGELAALAPHLSPMEQAQLTSSVMAAQAQGGDVYAIHVRVKNTGASKTLVAPNLLSLHLGNVATPLFAGVHARFLHGDLLPPGRTVEGILMFPANVIYGGPIRAGGGELRYNDPSVQATIHRR